jgi:hypothetical protein
MLLSDQINASSGAIWETSVVNSNYQTVGDTTTIKYLKASTDDDYWTVNTGEKPILYTLTFKVRNNAPTGPIQISFNPNYARVQHNVSGNITGQLLNHVYSIVLDTTAPITSVSNGSIGQSGYQRDQ